MVSYVPVLPSIGQKTRQSGGSATIKVEKVAAGRLFLPSALLVAVCLEPLAALVFGHLQPAFLFEVAHGYRIRAQFREQTCGLSSAL